MVFGIQEGSYHSRKLHDMANEHVLILGVFVSSVNLYNISMNMIGEINM